MDRHIGAQLYTVRDSMKTMEDFRTSMEKVKEIGYQIVQISGTALPAREMKEVLDALELRCVVTHRAFTDFQKDLDEVMEYNSILGCDSCAVGMAPIDYLKTNDGVSRFLEEVHGIADRLYDQGFVFGYHNHNVEFVKYEGKTIMQRILEETDPAKVKFVTDTYWLQLGGVDPASFIRKHSDRAMFVHYKDLRLDPESPFVPEFAEIGEGNLDFAEITKACDEAGVRYALVEQDKCRRDPFESLRMSYDYLKGLGFC